MSEKQPIGQSLSADGVTQVPMESDGVGGWRNSEVIVNPEVIYFDGVTLSDGRSLTITHSQQMPA